MSPVCVFTHFFFFFFFFFLVLHPTDEFGSPMEYLMKRKALCVRLIQWVTYENNCSHSLANTSPCPASTTLPAYPFQPHPPPHPAPPFEKKKSLIWILCLCQIHLLQSLKLELYDLRSYSFMIIVFEIWIV